MEYKVLKKYYYYTGTVYSEGEIFCNNADPNSNSGKFIKFLLDNGFIEELKKNRYWMPEKEEKYYTISNLEWDEGVVEKKYKEFTLEMQIGNYYETKEKAKKEIEKRKALQKIKEYINENFEYWKPNWKDEKENKYYINYDAQDGTFSRQSNQFYYSACPLYFRTYNEVNEIIEKFEPELKILFDIN